MCTVSYLPIHNGGFIITSTRDEKTLRKPALQPAGHLLYGKKICFPRDQDAKGTWIASCNTSDTLCLLNGGLHLHEHDPPYRKSRGLVLLDYYQYNNVSEYRDSYDFSGIEPFTLLVKGLGDSSLEELIWDGQEIHHKSHPADQPGIWSSVTLYTPEVIQNRKDWFEKWMQGKPDITVASIVHFHKTAGTGNVQNDILMNRENAIRSVSITSLIRQTNRHEFYYEDLLDTGSFVCSVS